MENIGVGWIAPPEIVVYCVIGSIYFGLLAFALAVARLLRAAPQWSLAGALSEEADLTDGSGTKTMLVASASRLIAFLGMVAILALFLGFGAFVLWGVAETGHPPAHSDEFSKYLMGGVSLFAPYVVNKFSAAFSIR
jgi:hypothetical protein